MGMHLKYSVIKWTSIGGKHMSRVKQGINGLYTWCIQNGDFGANMVVEFVGVDADGHLVNRVKRYKSW